MESTARELERLQAELAAAHQRIKGYTAECEAMRSRLKAMEDPGVRLTALGEEPSFGDDALRVGLDAFFRDVASDIARMGWEEFFRKVTSGNPNGAGGDPLTVIPSKATGAACNETALVLLGVPHDRAFLPFAGVRGSALDSLKLHLIECQRVRRVLVVSDWGCPWDLDVAERRWIHGWRARGVAFAMAIVTPGGKSAIPIPIPC